MEYRINTMQARYRTDYEGEFVITETRWTSGKKQQTREWVANPIINQHISGRAVCIGSNVDKYLFDYAILERHRGGLLGSKKLQTYGTSEISKEMRLDFSVGITKEVLAEIKQRNYQENNIVYTNSRLCINNPGDFYLVPYTPMLMEVSIPLYLAAFDGHQEIFLLGYHKEIPELDTRWIGQCADIIGAYNGLKFHFVGHKHLVPDHFTNLPNTSCLTYREFISYCDI